MELKWKSKYLIIKDKLAFEGVGIVLECFFKKIRINA